MYKFTWVAPVRLATVTLLIATMSPADTAEEVDNYFRCGRRCINCIYYASTDPKLKINRHSCSFIYCKLRNCAIQLGIRIP